MSLTPGTILDSRYEIIRLVHKSSLSSVYLACCAERKLIIKAAHLPSLEDSQSQPLLEWEYSLLFHMSYPHLPRVFDYFEEDGCSFLVEEYIEGLTLRERMQDESFCNNIPDIIKIIYQITGTLYYLNRKKIIYRDLKPAHIIMAGDGLIRLVDFGAARTYKKKKSVDTIPLGTLGFASPEHYGYGQTDERSEVFTVGALFYYLLTGCNPADSPFIFRNPCELNPAVSDGIAGIIKKATQMKPEDRYGNLKDLRFDLQRAAGSFFQRERLLFCPLCGKEMEIIKIGTVEIDGCPHCAGIWCDTRELEKIKNFKKDELSRYMKAYWEATLCDERAPSSLERELCCPVCGLIMSSSHHRPGSKVILDTCRGKCGKWLDGGEIRLIKDNNGAFLSLLRVLGAPFKA